MCKLKSELKSNRLQIQTGVNVLRIKTKKLNGSFYCGGSKTVPVHIRQASSLLKTHLFSLAFDTV